MMNKGYKTAILLLCLVILLGGDCLIRSGDDLLFDLQKISTPPEKSHYKHFVSRSSLIRLEFDYPETWIVRDDLEDKNSKMGLLAFLDPRYLNISTQSPNETIGRPDDIGSVLFISMPKNETNTLFSNMASFSAGCSNDGWSKKIDEYQVRIDNHIATIIECQFQPNEVYSTVMDTKAYFFEANNTVYSINFTIAENRRGDEFESGFEELIKSIKVVE